MDTGKGSMSRVCGSALFVVSAQVTAPEPSTDGWVGAIVFLVLMAALFAIIAAAVKTMDRVWKRSEDAVHLQASIADALLRDPVLKKLPVTATTQVPVWRKKPVTVDVRGPVPTPRLREQALGLAIREATRSGVAFRIVDRMVVLPASISGRAA